MLEKVVKRNLFSSLLFPFFMQSQESLNARTDKNDERWFLLRAKLYEEKIKGALRLFRENEIEPILIKGWAVAREYPEKHRRIYSDLDFCISEQSYAKALKLVEKEEARKFNIDLHCGLRHLDTVEWDNLFENSKLVEIDEVPVRILRPEDHLRVLCVHWLTDGGANKERLLDFYYLIQNHMKDFDWDRCLGIVSDVRREWICKTIGLVSKYYQLDVSKFSFYDETRELPAWLIKALEKEWTAGVGLKPLHTIIRNKSELWSQIKKRFPPNAIQATIDMEGRIDMTNRGYYQLGSMILRLRPSLRRIYQALKKKIK
jgi:hypothetical protein